MAAGNRAFPLFVIDIFYVCTNTSASVVKVTKIIADFILERFVCKCLYIVAAVINR